MDVGGGGGGGGGILKLARITLYRQLIVNILI